jgi:C4-dicarboxylate-specific signal transduction histidine kinase
MSIDHITDAASAALRESPGSTVAGPAATDGGRPLLGRMLNVSRMATIGEIAAGIAHEINQPLTAITNYSQACERLLAQSQAQLDQDTLRMALSAITYQAVRASQIIGRLRTLARHHEMRRTPTDVNDMIQEVAALAGADARARDVQLRLDLAPGLPIATLDSAQIQHVLLNLIRNAVEALALNGPGQRKITVRSRLTDDGELELSVSDNGPGLSDDVRSLVFDPFFSTKDGGTGLGLPISSNIVRAHGGILSYRHNQPQGACFFFHLPAQPEP